MTVTIECTGNSTEQLSNKLRSYAFTQDETGHIDLTVGKKYSVYGYRQNKHGTFYLVLTDTIHTSTPWWMPSDLFKDQTIDLDKGWAKRSFGLIQKDVIFAPKVYFDAVDDIEDGTPRGQTVFKQMQESADRQN